MPPARSVPNATCHDREPSRELPPVTDHERTPALVTPPGGASIPDAHLELRVVGEIAGDFFVPRYQRGYRWGGDDVKRLLNDIWANGARSYCLQPVVVKWRKVDGSGEVAADQWELVDGQQRLTTLHLIFGHMRRAKLQNIEQPYSIDYETRAATKAYLETLDKERSRTNIDFFHLYAASEVIREWFDSHGAKRQNVANKFYEYLVDSVHVIWYEAPPELDSTALFTRLNVGRIPLTDAELVKAHLLTSSRNAIVGGRPVDRSEEIAQQWDAIERDLWNDDVWAFVSEAGADECPTRITLLLDTLAGGTRGKRPRFHTFETLREKIHKDPLGFWEDVVDLHALVRSWFENRTHYHKVGYLVSSGEAFLDLVALAKGKRKSELEAALDARIRKSLDLSASDVNALSYESASDREKCHLVLRLMNVEAVERMHHSSERYSFHRARQEAWSLEHIHAQQTEGLVKAEQWRKWLDLHRAALQTLPDVDVKRRDALVARIDAVRDPVDRQTFQELAPDVAAMFKHEDASGTPTLHSTHSIANLALLSRDDNSHLNNAVFEVKRQRVLAIDRAGGFIPICTRQVFLKYFTGADAQQVHFWSAQDRASYLAAMVGPAPGGLVTKYLKPENGDT